jgi:hypothetical protein
MLKRRVLFTLLCAAALAGCTAAPVHAAAGRLVDVQIVDRARHDVLHEYRHRGATYVAGRPGDRYAVRLTNRTGARVLVVLSVDGVNAISGETAATAQTGYVLSPWQSAEITGWRKSDAEAAAFYFTALPDSYAARTGRPQNVGVIGVAAFRERVPLPRPVPFEPVPYSGGREDGAARQEPERRSADASAAGKAANESAASPATAAAADSRERDAAKALSRTERLGTGHGEREYAPIERTAFERASSRPDEIVQVRYDSRANLVAAGVIDVPRRAVPDPFPGFVADPPP